MSSSIFFRVDGSLVYPMEALSILGSVVYGSSGKEVHPLRKSLNQQRSTTARVDGPLFTNWLRYFSGIRKVEGSSKSVVSVS